MSSLDAIARSLPEVEEGIACAGTALECRTFLVKKKAFLFVSKKEIRLKLARSASDARQRGHAVGAGGWTKLDPDDLPATPLLKQWIAESYALFAGAGRATSKATKSKVARRPKR